MPDFLGNTVCSSGVDKVELRQRSSGADNGMDSNTLQTVESSVTLDKDATTWVRATFFDRKTKLGFHLFFNMSKGVYAAPWDRANSSR